MSDPADRVLPALGELRADLGAAGVLEDPADLARYCEPYRGEPGSTRAVLRPASVEQVRAVVRWARRHRIRLLPQGANSGLVGASTPPPGHDGAALVVVSLERSAAAPAVDPVDRTAVISAGTKLSQLEEAAAPHGLTLPIDLGADPTLGGMVATNTGGARMLRHGDMRRHVLGVRAVVADEHCSVVDELTTLRKHNVGPSLSQWFVGSSGAFGIVTDVAVELERRPSSRACAWLVPGGEDRTIPTLLHLEQHHGAWLEAFEVVSAEALDAALAHSPGVRPFGGRPSPPLSVLVEFAGAGGVTGEEGPPDGPPGGGAEAALVDALSALAASGLISDAVVVPAAQAWWPRHVVSEALRELGTVLGFDVSVPRPALEEFRRAVRTTLSGLDDRLVVADFGHWGDGGVHCNVVVRGATHVAPELRERVREVVLGTAVRDFGGSFSAEHGVGPSNAAWWRAVVPAGNRHLVRSVKQAFDPLGVLGHPGLPYGADEVSGASAESSSAPSSSAGTGREIR